jgi:hypothetical protein
MSAMIRHAVPVFAAVLLCQCAAVPEEPLGEPQLEKLEEARLDPEPESAGKPKKPALDTFTGEGLTPVFGKDGRFVIRDPKGAMRVDGTLRGGRMDGFWQYFDPAGRRLAGVTYRGDRRQGPVTLYFVSKDGKAAGRRKMTGVYEDGALNTFAMTFYTNGNKQLERDFDRGILQGVRGWKEDGSEMTDGAAQTAGLEVSHAEDALLSELEAFVQLKIRENAGAKPSGR